MFGGIDRRIILRANMGVRNAMTSEDRQAQMIRLLKERRGELIYDLRRNRDKGVEIADELTETERAIAELERERLSGGN